MIELSVIVPTYNEAANVPELVRRLHAALDGLAWEAVFVDDDSPDGTADLVKSIALHDPCVRCLHRVGRRGLAGACIEGILSSSAPLVAVMDADLQHDESLLPRMHTEIRAGADLVVGSRYVAGGSAGAGLTAVRGWGSQFATWLSRVMLKVHVSDPMSGFFMVRREPFERVADRLSPDGFKILLDFLATTDQPLRAKELPFTFRTRHAGESKLDASVTLEFLNLLFTRFTGGLVSVRFFLFLLVGASGLGVHLAAQKSLLLLHCPFPVAQTAGSLVAMVSNFTLNNHITFRDRRLRGWKFLRGLLSFFGVCSVGLIGNVGVASWVNSPHPSWQVAWWVSGTAGALMGALWNYAVSSLVTWRK